MEAHTEMYGAEGCEGEVIKACAGRMQRGWLFAGAGTVGVVGFSTTGQDQFLVDMIALQVYVIGINATVSCELSSAAELQGCRFYEILRA